jgi:hypothetical protein
MTAGAAWRELCEATHDEFDDADARRARADSSRGAVGPAAAARLGSAPTARSSSQACASWPPAWRTTGCFPDGQAPRRSAGCSPASTAAGRCRRVCEAVPDCGPRCWIRIAAGIPARCRCSTRSPRRIGDAAFSATTTRLLVDLNRSLHHPEVFSEFTRPLPAARPRGDSSDRWWRPWREAVADPDRRWRRRAMRFAISRCTASRRCSAERIRNADIGLLYDPARPSERDFCLRWQAMLAESRLAGAPQLSLPRHVPMATPRRCAALRRWAMPASSSSSTRRCSRACLAAAVRRPAGRARRLAR